MYSDKTLEKAKSIIEIGNAILQGKEIEFLDRGLWKVADTPSLNFGNYDYRIKPTPELIPFDFSDAEMFVGKLVRKKDFSVICNVSSVDDDGRVFLGFNVYCDLVEFFNKFTFLDGSPCGKIKE